MQSGQPEPTTKPRWENLYCFVLNDGSSSVPPIVMRRPEGLSPIDGSHRMAVLSGLRLIPEAAFASKKLAMPSNEQDVWTGRRRNGRFPDALRRAPDCLQRPEIGRG
jgi:hypothetical protein